MITKYSKLKDEEAQLLSFCQQGNLEAIENLFERVPHINQNVIELGLLMSCKSYKVLGEHQEIIQLLINKGANVNAVESVTNMTALMIACSKGLNHVIEVLLENKANVDKADHNGRTAIFFVLENDHGENSELISILTEYNCNLNAKSNFGTTPLLIAIKKSYEKCAMIMLKKSVKVDCRDADNNSLLHLAVFNESEPLITELLKMGLKNSKNYNSEGKTPSNLTNNEQIIKILEESSMRDKEVC
jgi:ankyrin repeat protein